VSLPLEAILLNLRSSGEQVYNGPGGNLRGNKSGGDEKLKWDNLALKNCIEINSLV
jgi:hypothetical protein